MLKFTFLETLYDFNLNKDFDFIFNSYSAQLFNILEKEIAFVSNEYLFNFFFVVSLFGNLNPE